jgi:SulP family sulfate permease
MSLSVASVLVVGMHRWPRIPLALAAIGLATVVAEVWSLPVDRIGALPAGLPAPSLGFVSFGGLGQLVAPALAVAALAALEGLLCATVADGMTAGERHDPDRELFGQGLANLAVPLFGGVPATAAIARTAVNVRAGARSKSAAVTHALVLLGFVSLLAPLVGRIPLAALAGVLLATAFHMVEVSSLLALTRGTRGDGVVLILTFLVTVALDLVTAVAVGVAVAIVLALREVARTAKVEEVVPLRGDTSEAEHALLSQHVAVFRFDGPLFFAAAQRFLPQLADETDSRVVVLRLSHVTTLDATGAHALAEVVRGLERRGKTVMISGIAPSHDDILERLGVLTHLRADRRIHQHTSSAIARALELVNETGTESA